MSTRRAGKKKTQPKQQQTSIAEALEGASDDVARPAVPLSSQTPVSPAVLISKLAKQAMSPVVTAAKATLSPVVTAAKAVLAPQPAMPIIPEDPTINTAHVEYDQPHSPKPSTIMKQPAFAMTAQKLFADARPQNDQQQDHDAAAAQVMPQQTPSSAAEDDQYADVQEAAAHDAPAQQHSNLATKLQQLSSSFSWKAELLLCAAVLLPLLVAVLVQGQILKSQTHALQAQQQLVAVQARALQDIRKELQDTSAQLPVLMHAAQATNSSLSTLTAEQNALLSSLSGLSNLTEQLAQDLGQINGSQQAGQQAWKLLIAVAQLDCAKQPGAAACVNQTSASSINATAVMQTLLQRATQQQRGQHDQEQRQQQQQLAQRQQELVQALPTTIKQEVEQQLSAQTPLPDLALADCGARIVSCTPINASALQQQLGSRYAATRQQQQREPGSSSGAKAFVLQLQRMLDSLPKLRPQAVSDSAASSSAAADSILAARRSSSNAWLQPWDQQQQQLLHRVLLRPVSELLPVSCVPLMTGPNSNAVVELQLPQPAHIQSLALHALSCQKQQQQQMQGACLPQPGRISLVLLNSSSCGGPTATCMQHSTTMEQSSAESTAAAAGANSKHTGDSSAADSSAPSRTSSNTRLQQGRIARSAPVLRDGVVAFVREVAPDFKASGRAVIPVHANAGKAGADMVLADRVVVLLPAADAGTCLGRISVYGRPSDTASFC
jgi:hypothetical protein